jgi:hypothetical protein
MGALDVGLYETLVWKEGRDIKHGNTEENLKILL